MSNTPIQELDVRAQELSLGLERLYEFLDNPVAQHALELSKNASAAAQFDILKRLRQSLKQYLERNGYLFYVGLLGHFSAGKSSTINSLLGAWGGKSERPTDQNPTDTTITLITQEKNGASLIGVVREGHVKIRLQTVDNPLLGNLVIADTPGTGDPQFIEEVARDFLPICDVIFFLLSAASPLDKSDIPMLIELHRRLPFIHMHFVVTRADEFRKDFNQPLSESNLDKQKQAAFFTELASRVSKAVAPQIYTSDDFIAIDNRGGYNIERLASLLKSRCDSTNLQAHTAMHNAKLHFYHSNAKWLRDYFAGVLEAKLIELNNIVLTAQQNIERYQENVQISNSNLTKAWTDNASSISVSCGKVVDRLKVIVSVPQEVRYFSLVTTRQTEILKDLSRDAKTAANGISAHLKSEAISLLQDHFYSAQKLILETRIPDLTAATHGIKSVALNPNLSDPEMFSATTLSRRCNDVRDSEATAIRELAGDMRRMIKDSYDLLLLKSPLTECNLVIKSARESLTSDLDKFFHNVELYRSGVFSHKTKLSISALGIGDELDKLEKEFTEDDRSSLTMNAADDLFPDVEGFSTKSQGRFTELAAKVHSLNEDIRVFKIESPENNFASIENAASLQRSLIQSELTQLLQVELDRFCGEVGAEVSQILLRAKGEYEDEARSVTSARRRRYWSVGSITTAVGSILYFAYAHSSSQAPTSTVGNIALGVAANVIFNAITLLITKLKENVPKMLERKHEKLEARLKDEIRVATDVALRSRQFVSLDETTISNRLVAAYQKVIQQSSEVWRTTAVNDLSRLRAFHVTYASQRQEYLVLIEDIKGKFMGYFSDSSKNLEVLTEVAHSIKQRAIEPSFELLNQTRTNLELVKEGVGGIDFS